jgi:hypothetical protein
VPQGGPGLRAGNAVILKPRTGPANRHAIGEVLRRPGSAGPSTSCAGRATSANG